MLKKILDNITPYLKRKEVILNKNGEPHLIRYIIWGKQGSMDKQHHGRGLYLQKLIRSDLSKDLYDHPWRWGRLILWGQFKEKIQNKASVITHERSIYPLHLTPLVSSRFAHTTELLDSNKPVWMLFWHGRARNQWGYWIDNKKVNWREYFKLNGHSDTAHD